MVDRYSDHEANRPMSCRSSAEVFEAELAWNAAVQRMRAMLYAAHSSGITDWFLTLDEELSNMDTGLTDGKPS